MFVDLFTKKKDWRYHRRTMIINHEVANFSRTFRHNFVVLIISAMGLVAALSWNDAITTFINTIVVEKTALIKFIAAVLITIVSITLTYFLSKFKNQD